MDNNCYKIKTISNRSECYLGNIAEIAIYNWNCAYQPRAYAKMCYIKDQGFAVSLVCEERNPLASYTKANCMVCEDSCLEVFIDYKPQLQKGYINFEANANGSLLVEHGMAGENRKKLIDMGINPPEITAFKGENEWGYDLFIPLTLIEQVYGTSNFELGDKVRGNFFKCGDKTEHPHYGSFTKIDWKKPSFHRPEFFADMIIE